MFARLCVLVVCVRACVRVRVMFVSCARFGLLALCLVVCACLFFVCVVVCLCVCVFLSLVRAFSLCFVFLLWCVL